MALWKSITGQNAALPLSPEPSFHASAYNISLNITSIIAFPSRLLARIRKADDFLFQDAISSSLSTGRAAKLTDKSSDLGPSMFPGPYGFFLSGYMVGLVALAVLLHRIQNIVVPPRSSSQAHHISRGLTRRFYGYTTFRRLYGSVIPLDLNRTTTRLAFHLPTLYFLCKMLLIWTVILLQTSDLFPGWESGYVYSFGQWTQSLQMHDVCWRTFCSICAAFSMEAFVRGLDGGGLGLIQMNANTSPFNLIGYAFLLHLYSSPITHVYKPPSLPSRPDKHVIVTITIPLLQLTIFHIVSIRKRWSNHRLFPTALSSILSLLHFHMTLYSHFYSRSAPAPASPAPPPPLAPFVQPKIDIELPAPPTVFQSHFPAPTPPPVAPVPTTSAPRALYSRPTGSATFPLLNYVPNAFETLLMVTIALTVVLNALTQFILTGSVSRPLLGLGLAGTNGAWMWAPPYDEDWGVVLLRVGTASLEATGLRGWGNEMPAISAAPVGALYPEWGAARLGPSGVVHVSSGFGAAGARRYKRRGLANEVRDVDVGARADARTFGADLVNLRWFNEAWRFMAVAWEVGRAFVTGVWGCIVSGGKARGGRHRLVQARDNGPEQPEVVEQEEDEDQEEAVYGRFLRQEEISDDEDDPAQEWDLGESSESEGEHEHEHEHERELGDAEALGLYTDLGDAASAPVLLAHMTSDGSPLTRRRYGWLVGTEPRLPEPIVPASPVAPVPARLPDESRRNCVICTCDPREIICWPCRCLSMCDGCREVLASRSSASKHRCPCCRQVVEGYSRIFIP
ncbi:hypothetical protein DFH07DRAFT_178918 [Mycena maculata]|uniref:RING-type domain-containing protein n=1 Tax=Mycena maculata TaxID=230809 RepID=A0AAD7HX59_9AGAR|nr:hypothetical protein DFH07DRAFT_178918 [Mycena maculata]